ncbi:hypothetical protein HPSA50_1505 [Helicobacter pylori SouthAfrica50]|uniref:Uncharacterized protein n=1 Tax=Helicobacter pylori SouthAfrica50 TaxID=1352357 RepID=T2S9B6_HELPX|nr:hypothetical protein HPSA50_1505 [Helicobacter pylori SouthAfrica50]
MVQISSHPPTHYTIYPKRNRLDDWFNPTNPPLKETKQEFQKKNPHPKLLRPPRLPHPRMHPTQRMTTK